LKRQTLSKLSQIPAIT
jgi:hypothetical protein